MNMENISFIKKKERMKWKILLNLRDTLVVLTIP